LSRGEDEEPTADPELNSLVARLGAARRASAGLAEQMKELTETIERLRRERESHERRSPHGP
jgi:chromosome segregation ATPase